MTFFLYIYIYFFFYKNHFINNISKYNMTVANSNVLHTYVLKPDVSDTISLSDFVSHF